MRFVVDTRVIRLPNRRIQLSKVSDGKWHLWFKFYQHMDPKFDRGEGVLLKIKAGQIREQKMVFTDEALKNLVLLYEEMK
jgi:hypothetical protein